LPVVAVATPLTPFPLVLALRPKTPLLVPVVAVASPTTALPVGLALRPTTPAANGSVLDVAPQMPKTPVLSTSRVACGLVVPTPMLSPAWNTIEFPNVLRPVQRGMKFGVPAPKTTGVLVVGAVVVVFVGVWAKARAT